MKIGVSLLSGGLDSTVTTALAAKQCDVLTALTVQYGQRHAREIRHAAEVAAAIGVPHHVAHIPVLADLAFHSALTNSSLELPADRDPDAMADAGPPVSYVPMRNSVLLTMASALLESTALHAIEQEGGDPADMQANLYIGANVLDYSGYPDCRPIFYGAMELALNQGSKLSTTYFVEIRVAAPIINLTKADIIRMGIAIEAPIGLSWSCYSGGESPCGKCDSCILRLRGFAEVGVPDPAL